MFHLIKKGVITDSSDNPIYSKGWQIIEYNFSDEEKGKIERGYKVEIMENWELILIWSDESIEKEIQEIKKSTWEEIETQYPLYKQVNILADINKIHLTARQEERNFTEEEMKKVKEWEEIKNWIDEKRKIANEKILKLT